MDCCQQISVSLRGNFQHIMLLFQCAPACCTREVAFCGINVQSPDQSTGLGGLVMCKTVKYSGQFLFYLFPPGLNFALWACCYERYAFGPGGWKKSRELFFREVRLNMLATEGTWLVVSDWSSEEYTQEPSHLCCLAIPQLWYYWNLRNQEPIGIV